MTAMPAMGAPGLPMGGSAPGGMPQDPASVILQLLQEVMGRWQSGQMQIAGEQESLVSTLASLAQGAPVGPDQGGMQAMPMMQAESDPTGVAEGAPQDTNDPAGAPSGY